MWTEELCLAFLEHKPTPGRSAFGERVSVPTAVGSHAHPCRGGAAPLELLMVAQERQHTPVSPADPRRPLGEVQRQSAFYRGGRGGSERVEFSWPHGQQATSAAYPDSLMGGDRKQPAGMGGSRVTEHPLCARQEESRTDSQAGAFWLPPLGKRVRKQPRI